MCFTITLLFYLLFIYLSAEAAFISMQNYSICFNIHYQQMLIIGIAGGTGSGKTTVVRKIIESLPAGEVVLLPQDSYYKDRVMYLWKSAKISISTIRTLLNGACSRSMSRC